MFLRSAYSFFFFFLSISDRKKAAHVALCLQPPAKNDALCSERHNKKAVAEGRYFKYTLL